MAGRDQDGLEKKMYPLPIYYENGEQNEESARSRGRGRPNGKNRGRSRGQRSQINEDSRDGIQHASKDPNRSSRGRGERGGRGERRGRGGRGDYSGRGGRGDFSGQRGGYEHVSGGQRKMPIENKGEENAPSKPRPPPFFPRDKLMKFAERKDIDEVLLDIAHSRSGFFELLCKKPDPKLVFHLIQLLSNVSGSTKMANRREIMQMVEKEFLHNLTDLLSEVSMKEESTGTLWKSGERLEKFLKNILQLLTVIITTLPSSLAKCKNVVRAVKDVQEEFAVDDVKQELNDVEEVLQRERQAKQTSSEDFVGTARNPGAKQATARQFVSKQPTEPPDHFRDIPVFPTLSDFENKPFLRANKAEGKYESLDTYLDVQFRLLREDYIQPLRKGISEYRSCIKDDEPVRKLRDVKLYQSVQILRPVCSGRGINYIIQFDIRYLKNINWVASRRLLFGSLLCLSKDHFETVLYAVVTDRNEKELKDGNIQVHFENIADGLHIGSNDEFIMVESSAYFEAYRYILEGLLEIKDTIPFQRYMISCEDTIKPPKYLLGKEAHYDFSCLLDDDDDECFPPIPVLNTQRWPSCLDLGLDRTQYDAIKTAITKELAIIQGPPGTGKTFVGLKITKLLLKNSEFWGNKNQSSPILVVCYTNHALDQFLEAIMDFSEGKIVRIGGRCKSERLEPFILRNVKKQRRDNRERSFRLMQKERDCIAQLKTCERKIAEVSAKIKKTTTSIISYQELEEFMTESQKYGFQLLSDGHSPNIHKWMGLAGDQQENDLMGEASVREIWEHEIIANIYAIPEHEKIKISDPWALDLKTRAELYKSWLSEFLENVQITLENTSNYSLSQQLQTLEYRAKDKILDVATLLALITTLPSKIQIQMLFAGQVVSMQNLTQFWLKVTSKKKESIQEIRNILETMMETNEDTINVDEGGEDLEEDRELDEDEFLFDYGKRVDMRDRRTKTDSDWVTGWKKKKMGHKVKNILSTAKQIDSLEAEGRENITHLEENKCKELYAYWVKRYRIKLRENVTLFEKEFNEATEKILEVRDMETVEILNAAEVIGMTTTGAAKYRKLFQSVRPKIIIVEEAAEVLESHIVTTLNQDCQHLILIGDHKQLRPSTAVYDLSKRYHMDVSLFERMVRNEVPYVTLEEQHRMRPEISTLLKHDDLYPHLRDHPSVSKYKNIKGIDSDVQFIDHEETEATATESTSYSNPHEAKYISSLCQYLLYQGYKPDQITVITPYMGQVFLLRREMPKTMFEGVRITAIDNYQGEENDIILLSLVRSNSLENRRRNRIGFVGIENRICVSLSRAKEGLYVVGNFKLLAECSSMWSDMIQGMKDKGRVHKSLTLRCQNHPDQLVYASSHKDFQKVPSGGCQKSCRATLSCGHMCPKNCHVVDKEHLQATCTMPCEKIVCEDGHRCTLKCWQPCGSCKTMVEKALPLCQHKARMPCFKDVYLWKCHVKCEAILPCGHRCNKDCYKCTEDGTHEQECKHIVEKILECKHAAMMMCHVDSAEYQCKVPCDVVLDCTHVCSGKCGTCFGGRIHNGCKGTCKKALPCGHECSFPCSEICPQCTKSCGFVCSRGVPCKKKCWETCDSCNQPCKYSCAHQKCDHDCNENCPAEPCKKRCLKRLECGHPCRSLCGEICVCIICNLKYVRATDSILQTFDESTCFMQMPECKCIFEVERLDRYMHDNNIARRAPICKRCPHCSKPIRKNMKRYSNILKQIRAKIVAKFVDLRGSEGKRNIHSRSLRIQVNTLGITNDEKKKMCSQLDKPNDFDTLHTTRMKIGYLKDLLNVTNEIQTAENSGISFMENMRGTFIIPKCLRKLIIDGKKFTTSQFWEEIDREITRLRLGLGIYRRKKNIMRNHVMEEADYEMFKIAVQVLEQKDLNRKRIGALLSMINALDDTPMNTTLDPRVVSELIDVLTSCKNDHQAASRSERNATNEVMSKGKPSITNEANPDVTIYGNGSDEYFDNVENASDCADPVMTTVDNGTKSKLGVAAMVSPQGISKTKTNAASFKTDMMKTEWKDLMDLDIGELALS